MRWIGLVVCAVLGCAGQQRVEVTAPYTAIRGPLIIAHRGGSLEAPENTKASIQHGIDAGADWIEIDVVLSKDGHVMVVHEDELERYAHVEGRVSEKTKAELQEIFVGNPGWSDGAKEVMASLGVTPTNFGTRFAEETIPTLDEVLALGGRMMIEMKSTEEPQALADGVLESVKNAYAYDRVALGSFDPALLDAVAFRDPSMPLIGIVDELEMIPTMLERFPKVIAVRADLAAETVQQVPAGIAVWVWTIYSP
ncbi:MAG: glycerophosphodiester phosphodiesterase family protein, partial [Myxococcota bacterium]